jgi:hypothetical protein
MARCQKGRSRTDVGRTDDRSTSVGPRLEGESTLVKWAPAQQGAAWAIEGVRSAWNIVRGPIQLQSPTVPATVPPTPPDSSTKRGFDDKGEPYVEVRLPDGTVKRTQQTGVTLFRPDGTSQFIPNKVIRANAPPATPPVLPSDPGEGRAWVERHDEALLDLISTMVGRDAAEMKKFSDAEQQAVGGDLFQQIIYRTNVASFLAASR